MLPWLALLPLALFALLLRFEFDLVARTFGWLAVPPMLVYRWVILNLVPRWSEARSPEDAASRVKLREMLSRARRARKGVR